jgi:probable phosphoglycerate mutase
MRITLIRHGEPEWVKNGLNVDNPPLTIKGQEQAEMVASYLADTRFDEIYVSPLLRAQQTAAPLLRQSGRTSITTDWLQEIRNPIWHGTPVEKAVEAYKEERSRPSHQRWDGLSGGEAVSDFVGRINEDCARFLSEHGYGKVSNGLPVWTHEKSLEKHVAFVAHAGTNSVVICHLLGLDPTPWEWERFVLGHASISEVEPLALSDGVTFSLTRLSGVEHLPKSHRTV